MITLPVRRHEIVAVHGRRRVLTVFCPSQRHSVDVRECRACPRATCVSDTRVDCTPKLEMPQRSEKRLGDVASVGEAMGERHVSVEPAVAARVLVEALRVEPVAAALLVDEGDRLIGTIERDRAMLAFGGESAINLSRISPFVVESASLAEAVERLVTMHLRYLPVVDAHGRVVGLLSDLDALRWVVGHRRSGS
jgi:hypothetical protein